MEKALTFKEIAILYFKNSSTRSAVVQLGRWIRRNMELKQALDKAGFVEGQRIYSPRQVKLIFNYLGDPSGSP